MGTTTTFTIIHGCGEYAEQPDGSDRYPAIDEINEWLAGEDFAPLADLSQNYAGSRVPTHHTWGGAFRGFSREVEQLFLAFALSRRWADPAQVLVIFTPDGGEGTEVWRPAAMVTPSTTLAVDVTPEHRLFSEIQGAVSRLDARY